MASMYSDLLRPPLNQRDLSRALTRIDSRWRSIEVVETVPSTNAALVERVRQGQVHERVLVSELQTAGRGRFDRSWVSPPRAGITMSVLIQPAPDVPVARWAWVTLLTGLAVAAAVRQVSDVPAMLKWPNDVVIDEQKVAGLLAEGSEGPAGGVLVIGIGLNVTTTAAELPAPTATSLLLAGASVTDRLTLVKAILRRLEGLLAAWEKTCGHPSEELLSAYRSACSTLGRDVIVHPTNADPVAGRAVGIDDSGRLLVQTEYGQQAFSAGDVVHARPST